MECYVCRGRLKLTELGHKRYRHRRCCPGSVKWCTYWESLPAEERRKREAGRILYTYATQQREKVAHGQ